MKQTTHGVTNDRLLPSDLPLGRPSARPSPARPSSVSASPVPVSSGALLPFGLAIGLAFGIAACGGSGSKLGAGNPAGTLLIHNDPSILSKTLVVDDNQSGEAQSLKLVGVFWGRLVNVYDQTLNANGAPQNQLQQQDMVVGENIHSDNNFLLEINAVTEETSVTILHPYSADPESNYQIQFRKLDLDLTPIADKSLEPDELPPYSLAPRNAALVVRFNDLLDSDLVNGHTIRLLTGNPPIDIFQARVVRDVNHGDLIDRDGDGTPEFYSTRVILDTTISVLEAGATNPPLGTNPVGLPPSVTTNQANVALRIPTKKVADVGQLEILRNASGHPVAFTNNGSVDADSPTKDVVRAMRSGGNTAITNDVHNGFLIDEIPPKMVGTQPVQITTPTGVPGDFHIALTYTIGSCASALKAKDILEQAGVFAQVLETSAQPQGGSVADVRFKILYPPNGQLIAGPAQVTTEFHPLLNINKEACFVRFTNTAPIIGTIEPQNVVLADSAVEVRFSKPMDTTTVTPFDSLMINRTASPAPTALEFVIGNVLSQDGQKTFKFVPVVQFAHTNNNPMDDYFVNIGSGDDAPTDLAGNPISNPLPRVKFLIEKSEPTFVNGGIALRFNSVDEIDNDTFPEVRGQFLIDFQNGRLRPRSVSRYSAIADRTQALASVMPPFAAGVQTPLSGLGSKLQTIWRYCDVGFGLLDESNTNVDIENMAWAPVGGAAVADNFERFEISLAHSVWLPDETVDPLSLLPIYPGSGLVTGYTLNLLDPNTDPLKIVHERTKGYVVNPADLFPADTGTLMMPFPLNRGIPVSEFQYYTWRDTAVLAKGGKGDAPGAELRSLCNVIGGTGCTPGLPYANSKVPTIGLPILMEFKTFPDDGALGLNSFDINFAVNSSARPNFRAFSTGGVNASGQVIKKDPDLQLIADGGFNPTSTPPGASTAGADNTFYVGQLDLVLRISRAHTIFFNTAPIVPVNPQYLPPVVEPSQDDQPNDTEIVLAYRGAANVTGGAAPNIPNNANNYDAYGNSAVNIVNNPPQPPSVIPILTITFFPIANDSTQWKTSLTAINGAKLFQTRITFISSTQTLLTPTLSALGFAFKAP